MKNDKTFMQDEIDACQAASDELIAELNTLNAELAEYDANYAGPANSYSAIGLKTLSASEQEHLQRILREAPGAKDKLMVRSAELKEKAEEHFARQERIIAAQRKYSDALAAELDEKMTKGVDRLSGLLAFGLACHGMTGPTWRFAQAVIQDFRDSKTHANRRGHFETLQSVLESADYPPINPRTPHLDQFEKLEAEEASAYYNKFKREIISEQQARQNAANQP